jgi:hypothetical protein
MLSYIFQRGKVVGDIEAVWKKSQESTTTSNPLFLLLKKLKANIKKSDKHLKRKKMLKVFILEDI